jgi:hypothetical protein
VEKDHLTSASAGGAIAGPGREAGSNGRAVWRDEGAADAEDGARSATPESIATRLCEGFQHHDERRREAAIDAFAAVDAFQFAHVGDATARRAGAAYVEALWAKDAVEDRHRNGAAADAIDREALAEADWSAVASALAERAALVGIDPEYAALTTEGWRRHKVGGDYWTPHLRAQELELQAAVQDPDYPEKPRDGEFGAGPEATRYLLGVELHDCRRWEAARDVMVPYFAAIRREQASA